MAVRTPAPDTTPIAFAPVPVAPRRDGWTAERQRAFIHALATTGCVTEACAAVGMNARSAYHLRQRPDGEAFDRAWDVALRLGARRLLESALERALHGTLRHVRLGDTIVQERVPDTRLTLYLLDHINGSNGPFAYSNPAERQRRTAALLVDLDHIADSDAPVDPPSCL